MANITKWKKEKENLLPDQFQQMKTEADRQIFARNELLRVAVHDIDKEVGVFNIKAIGITRVFEIGDELIQADKTKDPEMKVGKLDAIRHETIRHANHIQGTNLGGK